MSKRISLRQLESIDSLDMKSLRAFLVSKNTVIRSRCLRQIRHRLKTDEQIQEMVRNRIDLFIVRTLDCETKNDVERMEALKIVRTISLMHGSNVPMSMIRSVVAIAASTTDSFRGPALEVLRILSCHNISIVSKCGGVRVMVEGIVDPTMKEMSKALCVTLLFLLENHHTRKYLTILDISPILSPFTDNNKGKWEICKDVLMLLLKSWAGLYFLATDRLGLRSLIHILVQPVSLQLRVMVLKTIDHIFQSISPFEKIQRQELTRKNDTAPSRQQNLGRGPYAKAIGELLSEGYSFEYFPGARHDVVDNYLAAVVLAFAENGLVDALTELAVSEHIELSMNALRILSSLKRCAMRLLPEGLIQEYFFTPSLVSNVTKVPCDLMLAQRSMHLISLFSKLEGCGYQMTVETLVGMWMRNDKVGLATEILSSGANISEMERLSLCIYSRPALCTTPFTGNLLVGRITGNWSKVSQMYEKQEKRRKRDRLLGKLQSFSKAKRVEKKNARELEGQHRVFTFLIDDYISTHDADAACKALSNIPLPPDRLSDRSHRRHIRSVMVTDGVFSDARYMYREIAKSQVLLGKDWKQWDWNAVESIVSGYLRNPGLLAEVLKTKFVKRIMGFFRATSIGEFIALKWTPENQKYTIICKSLLYCLLRTSEGVDFLQNDRRGKILIQIIGALAYESNTNDYKSSMVDESYFGVTSMNEESLRIFSPTACQSTMTRDLFSLLGAYSSAGLEMLVSEKFFDVATELARNRSKDYLTRLIILNLDYDSNILCRNWLKSIHFASNDIKYCILTFARAMLRRYYTTCDLTQWLLRIVLDYVSSTDEGFRDRAISILDEMAFHECYLGELVHFYPLLEPLLYEPKARPIFLRIAGHPVGAEKLPKKWLDSEIQSWMSEHAIKYAARIETLITFKLLCRELPLSAVPKSYSERLNGIYSCKQDQRRMTKPLCEIPTSIPTWCMYTTRDKMSSHDILALQRVPWRIEVWIENPGTGSSVYVPVDAYLDGSILSGTEYGSECDAPLFPEDVVVRAIPQIDQVEIPPDCVVYATLAMANDVMAMDGTFPHARDDTGEDSIRGSNINTPSNAIPKNSCLRQSNNLYEGTWAQFSCHCTKEGINTEVNEAAQIEIDNSGESKTLKSIWFTLGLKPFAANAPALPVHLFGELCKTPVGEPMMRIYLEDALYKLVDPQVSTLTRRSILWSIGHMASSDIGFELVTSYIVFADDSSVLAPRCHVIPIIIDIAFNDSSYSMRGTALLTLGLISSTYAGAKFLKEYGWVCRPPVAFPRRLFQLPQGHQSILPLEQIAFEQPHLDLSEPHYEDTQKILQIVSEMSNPISFRQAYGRLTAMRGSQCLQLPSTLLRLHYMLGNLSFDANVRRMILDLAHHSVKLGSSEDWDAFDAIEIEGH